MKLPTAPQAFHITVKALTLSNWGTTDFKQT